MGEEVDDVGVVVGAGAGIVVVEDLFGDEGVGGYDSPVRGGYRLQVDFPPRFGEGLGGGFAVNGHRI